MPGCSDVERAAQARCSPESHLLSWALLLAGDARKRDLAMNATMSVVLGDTYRKVRSLFSRRPPCHAPNCTTLHRMSRNIGSLRSCC